MRQLKTAGTFSPIRAIVYPFHTTSAFLRFPMLAPHRTQKIMVTVIKKLGMVKRVAGKLKEKFEVGIISSKNKYLSQENVFKNHLSGGIFMSYNFPFLDFILRFLAVGVDFFLFGFNFSFIFAIYLLLLFLLPVLLLMFKRHVLIIAHPAIYCYFADWAFYISAPPPSTHCFFLLVLHFNNFILFFTLYCSDDKDSDPAKFVPL